MLECFFHQHEYTIQFFVAFGTCSSVIVALWLARKSSRPALKAIVDKRVYVSPEAQTTGMVNWDLCEDMISVTIDNVGAMPVYIDYFGFFWCPGFGLKKCIMQNPLEPVFRNQDLKIDPGQSVPIILTKDMIKMSEVILMLCTNNKRPYWYRYFMGLKIFTANGFVIKAKIGKELKDLIKFTKPI